MISKKEFTKKIKQYIKLNKDIENVDIAMRKLSPDFGGFYLDTVHELIIDTLQLAMNDKYEWISYWVYELEYGKKANKETVQDKDNKNIPIKTISDLYNMIINEDV